MSSSEISSFPGPATKLPGVGTTIFTVMSALAQQYDAINLSQGFPDFNVPAGLMERLNHHVHAGLNQYPPMIGIEPLRLQIAAKVEDFYGAQINPFDEITITSGATEALFVAIQAVIHNGDEVIVLDPAYDSYDPAIRLAGGITQHVPLLPGVFTPDWDRIEAAISPRTRMLVVNSPHNPCGSVFSASDLENLEKLVERHNLFILSDEVYEHMVFDGQPHLSLLTSETLRNRAFVVSSFGKTYHATGWKVGYCIAPALLTSEFRKVHQFVTFTTHTPTQWALADYMAEHPEHPRELPLFYQTKRDLFLATLSESAFLLNPSAGTYFQLADYSQLSNMPDTGFARWLTMEVGVAAIPVSVFYQTPPESRLVRFCFAKDDSTLTLACEKLSAIKPADIPETFQ